MFSGLFSQQSGSTVARMMCPDACVHEPSALLLYVPSPQPYGSVTVSITRM